MFALQHRVRVFVYQFVGDDVRYLLLRQKPAAEWPLGPVVGSVHLDEHLKDAIVREVREETGIRVPTHILDIAQPQKELFGDIGLVEWPFAYQAGDSDRPLEIDPGPMIGEFAWLPFQAAFETIETPPDRDTLVRLQLRLSA